MIFPTIDADGDISECYPPNELETVFHRNTGGNEFAEFRLHRFVLPLDTRRSTIISVFIDERFMMEKQEFRKGLIEKFIKTHAAWFATYGRRYFE